MKNLPIFLKVIFNIILYCIYVIFFWFIFGLIFPIILKLLDKPILNPSDPIFNKIAIILAFLILLLTIFLRKYFYISLDWDLNWNKNVFIKEKELKNNLDKTSNDFKINNWDKDDLEIYVWKEK